MKRKDLNTHHRLIGHVKYGIQYSGQALAFKDGASLGFLDAVGDAMTLSISTWNRLNELTKAFGAKGMTPPTGEDLEKAQINQLMYTALEKFVPLAHAYAVNRFQLGILNGTFTDDFNYHWWNLRSEIEGVKPPLLREKDTDFDAGVEFGLTQNVPAIGSFAASLLQFQIHETLCNDVLGFKSNETFMCDITGKTKTAQPLKHLMSVGMSQDWDITLGKFLTANSIQNINGTLNATAAINYFQKLWDFLDSQQTAQSYSTKLNTDVDKYFVSHIPATVPIVVGAVLGAMILVVVIAYFVGKSRSGGIEPKPQADAENGGQGGTTNPTFELEAKSGDETTSRH